MDDKKIIDLRNLNIKHSKLFNSIVSDIRYTFNGIVAELARGNENNMNWWVLNLSSRNVFSSILFINCCYIALIKRLIEDGLIIKGIIVYSKGLEIALKKYFNESNLPITVYYNEDFIDRLKNIFRPYYNFFCAATQFFRRYVHAFRTRKFGRDYSREAITLLDIFLFENSFKDNNFYDHYYHNILDFLKEEKKSIYYFPTFYNIRNYHTVFRCMRNAKQNFLIKEDFLKIRDYLYAIAYPIRIMNIRINTVNFMGVDIMPLIKREIYNSMASSVSMEAILNYRIAKRMKENGINIRLIVDWFENQPLDRGINAGFRKFYKNAPIIGYQGFIASKNYISLYPTVLEKNSSVIPHQIAVIGKGLTERTKEFCPDLDVTTAPAFRFQWLWREKKIYDEYNCNNVLLALPLNIEEGNNILTMVASILDKRELESVKFFIKQHPINTQEQVMGYYGNNWPTRFQFVSGELCEWIEKSTLLISSASSVCMESLARGIPAIVIGTHSKITLNPIVEDIVIDIWQLCYTHEELFHAILFYLRRDEDTIKRHINIGVKIRLDYFEPVTNESVRRFLRLQ
jgi:hypothetical protein